MHGLSEHDVFIFVSQIGLIIFAARIFGEIARRFGQPVIVGEVIAGVFLGSSVMGRVSPTFFEFLFPSDGLHDYLLQGISWLCVLFLLLITGLEIDVKSSLRHGQRNFFTAILSLVFSFATTFLVTFSIPHHMYPEGVNPLHTNLIVATALSVVAIPVIGKILFDLKIFRSIVGLNIITSGVLSDIFGWSALGVILALISNGSVTVWGFFRPLLIMILYLGLVVTAGRWVVDKIFDFLRIETKETTSVVSLMFALALLNGAIAHVLGIHVIFGAFVAGIMVGESRRITQYMRQSTQDLIFGVFAPIFFVLVGMQLKFTSDLDIGLIIILMGVSSLTKIAGGFLGALAGGIGRRNAMAVGFGLNTQGTMGIIVALIGMDIGVLSEELFSTIVLICVLTSLFVGPFLKFAINRVRRPLAQFFDEEHVFLDVPGDSKREVIDSMGRLMIKRGIVDRSSNISEMIWERESILSTAIGQGVALPHARMFNLKQPILCFFRLARPIDFESPDNQPVQLLFLELTDENDQGMQLNLISQVARLVSSDRNRKRLLTCSKEEDVHHIMSLDEHV